MEFYSRQLSDSKWGIYSDQTLLATVSCADICATVLSNLASGRSDAPKVDHNELYRLNTQETELETQRKLKIQRDSTKAPIVIHPDVAKGA